MKSLPPIPSFSTENFCFHAGDYSFGFNGKDKESEFNNGAYDFGARIHDARLGRWMSVDELVFKFPSMTPYNFALSNPLRNIDPDGRDIIDIVVQSATWTNDGSDRVLQVVASAKIKVVIYNNSSKTMDMSKLAASVESKMEAALSNKSARFSVTDDKDYKTGEYFDKQHSQKQFYLNVDIKIDVEVEVVNSLDAVDQNQTVVILTDQIVDQMGRVNDPAGMYYNNGVALVETKKFAEPVIVRCIIHEVGHDLGMNDLYKTTNGEVTSKGAGYMGSLDPQGGEYFSNKSLGEFQHSVMQTVWTSLHNDKNKKVHNKKYPTYSRSADAKKVAKNGIKAK